MLFLTKKFSQRSENFAKVNTDLDICFQFVNVPPTHL